MSKIRLIVISTEKRIPTLLYEYASKFQVEILINNSYKVIDDVAGSIVTEDYDFVFLDIDVPEVLSHKMVKKLLDNTLIVGLFTSEALIEEAYMEILFSAIAKPIDSKKIDNILDRYFKMRDMFKRKFFKSHAQKLLVPSISGFSTYDLNTIVRFEADGNYTKIYFEEGHSVVVSKSIKSFSRAIKDFRFVRVHNKHMICTDYIQMFSKGKTAHIQMLDGALIPIAESKKQLFIDVMNAITLKVQ